MLFLFTITLALVNFFFLFLFIFFLIFYFFFFFFFFFFFSLFVFASEEEMQLFQEQLEQYTASEGHIEAVAERIVRAENLDDLSKEEVGNFVDQKPFAKNFEDGTTWEEEAEDAADEFEALGIENPVNVQNRVRDRAARGLPNEDSDFRHLAGYSSEDEVCVANENSSRCFFCLFFL
jgi:hypothetical protein